MANFTRLCVRSYCPLHHALSFESPAQSGYSIRLHLKPYTGGKVYLGYYYGKIKALADSAMLDANSDGVFSGKEKLPGGAFILSFPRQDDPFRAADRQ
jgi:hypothetical protein